jgi:acetyl esterase/lipase
VENMPEGQDIDIRKNIPFGVHDGDRLTGDYYAPPGTGPYPTLVAVHGGGWQLGTAESYQYWGAYLAHRGYVLFAINYRLVRDTKNRYPAAVHDTRAAVQFLRSQAAALKVDPTRIGCIGDSAGAHLAALVALAGDSPPFADAYPHDPYADVRTHVKAVVGIYGAYDLLAQWQHDQLTRPRDHITERFLGKSPMESKHLFYEASPLTYTTIDKNHTALLVVWGTEDDIADPRSQSEVFVTALKQAGFFVRTVIVPGAPHFWVRDPIDEPTSYTGFLAPRLLRFLQNQL